MHERTGLVLEGLAAARTSEKFLFLSAWRAFVDFAPATRGDASTKETFSCLNHVLEF